VDRGFRRKFLTQEVKNAGGSTAERALAVLELTAFPPAFTSAEREFALHWAGLDYVFNTSGGRAVDISAGETRRLDLIFTHDGGTPGCWVATDMALYLPTLHQHFLPPGEYRGVLRVTAAGAPPLALDVKFTSPGDWSDLDGFVTVRRRK
jgi:hypothetical protein